MLMLLEKHASEFPVWVERDKEGPKEKRGEDHGWKLSPAKEIIQNHSGELNNQPKERITGIIRTFKRKNGWMERGKMKGVGGGTLGFVKVVDLCYWRDQYLIRNTLQNTE
jgi:hypothetical protein